MRTFGSRKTPRIRSMGLPRRRRGISPSRCVNETTWETGTQITLVAFDHTDGAAAPVAQNLLPLSNRVSSVSGHETCVGIR